MGDVPDPSAESAEKAYAEAIVEAKKPRAATQPAVAVPIRADAAKTKTREPSPKKKTAKNRAATPVATPTVIALKEKIMATAKTTDFTKPINEAIGEFQARAKVAYEKSSEALTEATEFTRGNVEAIVESGKILAGGAQDFGKTYVEEAKSAYETLTADLKELAAVKSPTELFQLQGKIARRNFDALVANGSKTTEAAIKLASEAFAPISGRVNVAAEKLTRAA
jgi:phasin family protein